MQLIISASAHTHEQIKTQLIQGMQYCNEELNIKLTLNNPEELDALKKCTSLKMGDGAVRLVSNRRDNKQRKGPDAIDIVRQHIDKTDRIIIPSTNSATESTMKYCLAQETTVTILNQGVTVHAAGSAGIEVIQQLDTENTLNERHSGGRPPLGCEVEAGQLVKGDDFERVQNALQAVVRGDLSKSEAAERLGCARQTITNAAQRRSLYSLN